MVKSRRNSEKDRQLILDDLVHEAFSRTASAVNNDGEEAQIAYLMEEDGLTRREIEKVLEDRMEK